MFNNTHFLEVNEELIRILNLLANFAELNQLNDYTFDVKTHTFALNKVEKTINFQNHF